MVQLDVEEAIIVLEDLGLVDITQVAVFSRRAPGTVIRQNPEAGESVDRTTPVELRVSQGRRPVDLPDFTGMPVEDAVRTAEELGLKAVVEEAPDSDAPAGTVVGQSPGPGSQIVRGQTVTLRVSAGPPAPEVVTVPDVFGLPQADAEATLANAGFGVAVATVAETDPAVIGLVLGQNPAGGVRVEEGTLVTITVAVQAAEPPPPPPEPPPPVEPPPVEPPVEPPPVEPPVEPPPVEPPVEPPPVEPPVEPPAEPPPA